jgi:hypothetical protein
VENDSTKPLGKVIRIDESEIRGHLDQLVRGTVEDTLNAMLEAEADELCQAQRYERSADRITADPTAGLSEYPIGADFYFLDLPQRVGNSY